MGNIAAGLQPLEYMPNSFAESSSVLLTFVLCLFEKLASAVSRALAWVLRERVLILCDSYQNRPLESIRIWYESTILTEKGQNAGSLTERHVCAVYTQFLVLIYISAWYANYLAHDSRYI